jgi:quercetin dioxygenase-like cupin family protein
VHVESAEAAGRVLFAVATAGEPFDEVAKRLAKDPKKVAIAKRTEPVAMIDLAAARDLAFGPGGSMHARLGFESGRASLGMIVFAADAKVAAHDHKDAWEALAVLKGDGALGIARGAPGGPLEPRHLRNGSAIAIPKGARHAWDPSGTSPLVAVQFYVPPGPEQRFKALAASGSK